MSSLETHASAAFGILHSQGFDYRRIGPRHNHWPDDAGVRRRSEAALQPLDAVRRYCGVAVEEKHVLRSVLQRGSNTGVHASREAEVVTGLDDPNILRPRVVGPKRRYAVVVDDDEVIDRSRRLQQRVNGADGELRCPKIE